VDLKQLEVFVCVAELGSFTRAAAQLRVAQPALSRQVRQLETELRRTLLLRNGRGVTVTEHGQVLLDHARGILHQVQRAREDLAGNKTPAGQVVVGMPPTLSRLCAIELTKHFCSQWPAARLGVIEGYSASLQEALVQGRLDVALLYNPVLSNDIELSLLTSESLVLVSPPGTVGKKTIGLEAIAQLPMIVPGRANAFRLVLQAELAALGLKPKVLVEIDGLAPMLSLVQQGMGHALLPLSSVAAHATADCVLRTIGAPGLKVQVGLAQSAHRPVTKTQQASIDWLKAHVPALIKKAA
jgi:LysR family transcriptional regulator, nitrogen assimilation regulatory protein